VAGRGNPNCTARSVSISHSHVAGGHVDVKIHCAERGRVAPPGAHGWKGETTFARWPAEVVPFWPERWEREFVADD
jgi:hypothetical protein